MRCDFETKQRITYLFKFGSAYGGPLAFPNLVYGSTQLGETGEAKFRTF